MNRSPDLRPPTVLTYLNNPIKGVMVQPHSSPSFTPLLIPPFITEYLFTDSPKCEGMRKKRGYLMHRELGDRFAVLFFHAIFSCALTPHPTNGFSGGEKKERSQCFHHIDDSSALDFIEPQRSSLFIMNS